MVGGPLFLYNSKVNGTANSLLLMGSGGLWVMWSVLGSSALLDPHVLKSTTAPPQDVQLFVYDLLMSQYCYKGCCSVHVLLVKAHSNGSAYPSAWT